MENKNNKKPKQPKQTKNKNNKLNKKNKQNTSVYKSNNNDMSKTMRFNFNSEELNKTKQYSTKQYKIKPSKKPKKQKPKKEKKKWVKWLKRIILTMFILGILTVLIVAGILAGIFFSDKYKVTREDVQINNFNSKVLDSEGNIIAVLNGDENRKWTSIENMPEYLPKMFVALEDERFYEHKGIDLKRTLGATAQFITKRGSSSYGGSTITQQLIKNTFEDKADEGAAGIERKIREMARAFNTEKVLSKSEILEYYLNKIFMGGTYYGVGIASEYYFSKDVKDLSLAEAAYIVGINTSPNAYEPFSTDETEINRIKSKVKVVLAKFKEQAPNLNYLLTEEAYNSAVAEVEAGLAFKEGNVTTNKNSYSFHTAAAIDQAVKDLAEQNGLKENEARTRIENNGYIIYSTQISSIQAIMQEEFLKQKYIAPGHEKKKDGTLLNEGHTQSAMVIIEPTTGNVVGCMGGLGTDSNPTGYNRATQGTKQPGSSIKPIGVVAPALEKGVIMASTVYDDSATSFGGYRPHNSGGYNGLMTVRHAIEHSSNIVNIKILMDLGPENGAEFLRQMNFDKLRDEDIGPSLALGATSTTPLQMAAAYSMIANNGVYIEPTFYSKIVDMNGKTVLEPKQDQKRMMTEQNAYVLKEILTAPVTGAGGTATTCWISGMEVGAKTGSTDKYKDRWLCGITPYYAGACWFGYDNAEVATTISGNGAARIWGEVMRAVHKPLANKRFEKPSDVVSIRICKDSGCVATESCERTEVEYFAKGNTPKQCEGHKKLKICKETGKIANDFCKDTEEKTFVTKPAKENTKLWSTSYGDKFNVPTEVCDVHKEPEKVKVVGVVGKTLNTAKSELEKIGLKVEIKYKEDDRKKDGIVLDQSINEGTEVEKGKTITLTINKIEKKDDNKTNTQVEGKTNTTTSTDNKTNTTTNNKTNEKTN